LDRLTPSRQLVLATCLTSLLAASYGATGEPPSLLGELILGFVPPLVVLSWVLADASERSCVPCFDFGFVLWVFLPISLVWYVLSTRGRKGLRLLFGLLGLLVAPWISWAAAAIAAAIYQQL